MNLVTITTLLTTLATIYRIATQKKDNQQISDGVVLAIQLVGRIGKIIAKRESWTPEERTEFEKTLNESLRPKWASIPNFVETTQDLSDLDPPN